MLEEARDAAEGQLDLDEAVSAADERIGAATAPRTALERDAHGFRQTTLRTSPVAPDEEVRVLVRTLWRGARFRAEMCHLWHIGSGRHRAGDKAQPRLAACLTR